MQISRRGLFGAAAGVVAVPFVKAEPDKGAYEVAYFSAVGGCGFLVDKSKRMVFVNNSTVRGSGLDPYSIRKGQRFDLRCKKTEKGWKVTELWRA